MQFDDLDAKTRRFEAAHDHCVLPGIFMVAGIDRRLHGLAAGCRS